MYFAEENYFYLDQIEVSSPNKTNLLASIRKCFHNKASVKHILYQNGSCVSYDSEHFRLEMTLEELGKKWLNIIADAFASSYADVKRCDNADNFMTIMHGNPNECFALTLIDKNQIKVNRPLTDIEYCLLSRKMLRKDAKELVVIEKRE